jgi:hypothetical protein
MDRAFFVTNLPKINHSIKIWQFGQMLYKWLATFSRNFRRTLGKFFTYVHIWSSWLPTYSIRMWRQKSYMLTVGNFGRTLGIWNETSGHPGGATSIDRPTIHRPTINRPTIHRISKTDDWSTDYWSTDDWSTYWLIDLLIDRPTINRPRQLIDSSALVPTYLLQAYFWG